MSEERIKERCKREDIALKVVKGFLEKDCYTDTELEYSLNTLLELYKKQKEEIERLKNAEEYARLGKEILLDTIHKQEEEIEDLKRDYEIITDDMKNHNVVYTDMPEFEERYISKDKIREKIEEEEEHLDFGNTEMEDHTIAILNELLEEK